MEAEELEQEGKYKEAILLLDKAISKDDKFIGAYINRGADKSALGDYEKAIKDYEKVLSINPNNTLALFNIANNYKRIENYKKSLEYYNKAFTSKGGDKFYMDLADNDFVDLGHDFDVPGKEIFYERGITLFHLGSLNKSYSDFQSSIKQKYNVAQSHYWIGFIYLKTNQRELACENFNKSRDLGDKDAEAEIIKFCDK
ncbi:hypothetical protein FCR2A7T_06980 [Flavobacterium cauense R2A-7]|nr:hypothetical protein FCR2A7T_06980 [Flavobacterium cauense R2A-7]KGO79293.1 hypothetical protein Q762_14450 [Flavobacterium cauense R2A-7]